MGKSIADVNREMREKNNTLENTYSDFPIGTKVKNICVCQDMMFFNGDETGTVTKNSGRYLGIWVEWDKPRHYEGGYVQKGFNFEPADLILYHPKSKCPACIEADRLAKGDGDYSLSSHLRTFHCTCGGK